MANLRGMGWLLALENLFIQGVEEFFVEQAYGSGEIGFGEDEADVQKAGALADHADVDAVESVEDAAGDAGGVADVLADEADDDAVVFDGSFGELAELAENEIDVRSVVDGEGDADLAGGDHIDRGFVAVEDLEDAAQEAVRHQHARGV